MKKTFLLWLGLSLIALPAWAQLPRRAFFGVQMNTKSSPVEVLGVVPQSTAEAVGLQKDDRLLSLNQKKVNTAQEVIQGIKEMKVGEEVRIEVSRKDKTLTLKGKLKALPEEKTADMETIYGEVKTADNHLRTIITRPLEASQKLPVVVYVGGISCYSVDFAMDSTDKILQLCRNLTRKGYVTVRIDRPAMGDSKGAKPCSDCTLLDEVAQYTEAIKAIKQLAYVNAEQVFLFGHSMGGTIAPLVAQREKVKGIVAYGTVGTSFLEYLIHSRRNQAELYGEPFGEIDDYMRRVIGVSTMLLEQKASPEAVEMKYPNYKNENLDLFSIRKPAYMYELHDVKVGEMWEKFEGYSLIMWGKHDYVAHQIDHLALKKTIDKAHAGKATYVEVEKTNHGIGRQETLQEALDNKPDQFSFEAFEHLVKWLKQCQNS